MNELELRDAILSRLKTDLVGPMSADELLSARPSDVYMTGILWPIESRMGGEDDDGVFGDSENDQMAAGPAVVGQQRPCAMGISFATQSPNSHQVRVIATFGVYQPSSDTDVQGATHTSWQRLALSFDEVLLLAPGEATIPLDCEGLPLAVELHQRCIESPHGLLSTITLINRSNADQPDRATMESLTLFQTGIDVQPLHETLIVPRPPVGIANDADEESARLLYRHHVEFASGHQCSAVWEAGDLTATRVSSTWIPTAVVPAFSDAGDSVFADVISKGRLSAQWLSAAGAEELSSALIELVAAYETWVAARRAEIVLLPVELQSTAARHLELCATVATRMRGGANALTSNGQLRASFQLANAAMAMQHSWKQDGEGSPLSPLTWRPFQLGFILLAAESTCLPSSAERNVLDLLWFPTGGGKTEAYLALVAMLAWHRRLVANDAGGGNVAVMRYTLRLLTAQQFERAAAMLLACELFRLGLTPSPVPLPSRQLARFSIGLWVGKDATPNFFAAALTARAEGSSASAEQIENCYHCHKKLHWLYNQSNATVSPLCKTEGCPLGEVFGPWPVHTVDDTIYRDRPTLIVGTIDKFAQLPFKPQMGNLFGFGTSESTDLIIQDELHLISGPLGTIAGAYETAFDWLLTKNDAVPKIIGSTATIRRAEEQVRALFDRESCQFPPPGLTYENSGFAVVSTEKPGRLYAGVTTAGRSSKFTSQAVAGSLLQSGGARANVSEATRDGYATLLYYFNSLRELGGAIVQVLDDVPDSMRLYADRRSETARDLNPPEELTSRVSQRDIVTILAKLNRSCTDDDSVDAVLATNMVSVGVDVPRLGLMLVNGQPKTRSEYIQSTSRVGRAKHPGLVVCVMNSSKARDRSHYETFASWHGSLYRDVEATSVTPFASRARDKTLRTVLVSMLRHGAPSATLLDKPDLASVPKAFLHKVLDEIDRRIWAVDGSELAEAQMELAAAVDDWASRKPASYLNPRMPKKALLEFAENHAKRMALGKLSSGAWPTMNTMRSVEPSTPFRMAEKLASKDPSAVANPDDRPLPPWKN